MEVIILGRRDLKAVLEMPRVMEGVAEAYRSKARGQTAVWPLVSHHFEEHGAVMDIRSGAVFGSEQVHGLKMLNNFPKNAEQSLPGFNGMLMFFDSTTGIPQGVMDASYITCMRTGAAGALGARTLARPESETLLILGCGKQSIFQIAATLIAMPQIKRVLLASPHTYAKAVAFAESCAAQLREDFHLDVSAVSFEPVSDLAAAVGASDIIITVSPSRVPLIKKEWLRPGTHLSCIGADMEGKEEIDPAIFAGARVFADDLDQCVRVGEMELAISGGYIRKEDVAGELGQVLNGEIPGRTDPEQITLFDATGLALLDLVTGKRAVELAREKKLGVFADI